MNPIIEKQISILQEILPRHLEEGNWAESIGIDEIEQKLTSRKVSFESSQALRQLVEKLFLSLSLLDKAKLAEGRWEYRNTPWSLNQANPISLNNHPPNQTKACEY